MPWIYIRNPEGAYFRWSLLPDSSDCGRQRHRVAPGQDSLNPFKVARVLPFPDSCRQQQSDAECRVSPVEAPSARALRSSRSPFTTRQIQG